MSRKSLGLMRADLDRDKASLQATADRREIQPSTLLSPQRQAKCNSTPQLNVRRTGVAGSSRWVRDQALLTRTPHLPLCRPKGFCRLSNVFSKTKALECGGLQRQSQPADAGCLPSYLMGHLQVVAHQQLQSPVTLRSPSCRAGMNERLGKQNRRNTQRIQLQQAPPSQPWCTRREHRQRSRPRSNNAPFD